MRHLTYIIGKAPSEVPPNELRLRLEEQRNRARKAFEYFKQITGQKKSKKTREPSITKILRETGLTKEQFFKGLAKLKEE